MSAKDGDVIYLSVVPYSDTFDCIIFDGQKDIKSKISTLGSAISSVIEYSLYRNQKEK